MGNDRKSATQPLHAAFTIRTDAAVHDTGWHECSHPVTDCFHQRDHTNQLPTTLSLSHTHTHREGSIISRHFAAVIQSSKSEPVVSTMKGERLSASYRCVCMCVCVCVCVCMVWCLSLSCSHRGAFCGLLLISCLYTCPIVNLPMWSNISGNEA